MLAVDLFHVDCAVMLRRLYILFCFGGRRSLQHLPDRRRADAVAEVEQLALEPDVAPARVLPSHSHHQVGEASSIGGRPALSG
jgi:hypothetical protein